MSEQASSVHKRNGERARERPARLFHPVDSVIAALLFAVCGYLFYVSSTFDKVSPLLAQNIPPEFFPRLVMIVICLLTLGLPFEHMFLRRKGKNIDKDRTERIRPMAWLTVALLVLVIATAPMLGTLLTMIAVCALLPGLWGKRRVLLVAAFAVVFPIVVALLFNVVLGVYFEPGLLGISLR